MRKKGGKAGLLKWVAASTWHKDRGPWEGEGRDPKRGRVEQQQQTVSQFAKRCPSHYLLEKACPHAAGLGRVNKFAQKLLKSPLDPHSSPAWVSVHALLMTNFCDSCHVRAGILAIARKAGGEPGWGGVPVPPTASLIRGWSPTSSRWS